MNRKVGSYYLLGAGLLAAIAFLLPPLGWLLLWPAASLLLVATGYFGLGSKVYFKRNGRIHPVARALHVFTLLGHDLSRRHYAKAGRPWDPLTPQLWIGRQLTARETKDLHAGAVTAVLDLTAEFSEPPALRRLRYFNVPVLDLTAPSSVQLEDALAFIEREARHGIVYVHCKIGYSRTACIAGRYLLHAGIATDPDHAIRRLRAARPSIVIRPEAEAILREPTNPRRPRENAPGNPESADSQP